MTSALLRRYRSTDDEGVALIAVLGVMFVVTALLLTMLLVALRDATPAREDQDSQAAIAAAQAGVDDYLARLQANGNYATMSTDPTNPAMTPAGRQVPGTLTGATYRYQVVTTSLNSGNGSAVLKVTGTVNGTSRTFTTTFSPRGFLDFIYLTDKEDLAPLYSGTKESDCGMRWWEGRNAKSCTEIGFADKDVIAGPMHTNDTMLLNGKGVTFDGKATTAAMYKGAPCSQKECYRNSGNWPSSWGYDSTTFGKSKPVYDNIVGIPSANTELKNKAKDSNLNGCYFTGATHIAFSNTTMKVYSPNTTSNTCGFLASNRASLQTINVPDGNVIYIDQATGTITNGQLNSAQLSQVTGDANSSYPRSKTVTTSCGKNCTTTSTVTERTGALSPDYGAATGSAYVQGVVDGKITVAAAQDVIVTGNLTLKDDPTTNVASNDIIGLVPNSSVWVYHPVWSDDEKDVRTGTALRVNRIDAAILTVKTSFIVQNYDKGSSQGTLTVVGAISQNYRGTVGTGSGTTGYLKDYQYDNRFATGAISPPFFLAPTSGSWSASRIAE